MPDVEPIQEILSLVLTITMFGFFGFMGWLLWTMEVRSRQADAEYKKSRERFDKKMEDLISPKPDEETEDVSKRN